MSVESTRPFDYSPEKGADEAVSLLYKSFSNNLLLGQWELARACLSQLRNECHKISVDINDVLHKVAEYPYGVSLGSPSLNTPHELSWLCLLECKHQQGDSDELNDSTSYLSREVEFRLLLSQTCQDVNSDIVKELYTWFKSVILPSSNQRLSPLSKATLAHIQTVLLKTPSLGFALISSLSPKKKQRQENAAQKQQQSNENRNGENLQLLFITCLDFHLDNLSKCSVKDRTRCEEIAESIYTLLSLYDPVPFWNYSQLQQLFTRLLQLCQQTRSWLKKEKLLSVLLGRSCPYLVETFCKLDHELSLPSRTKHSGSDGLSEGEREVLHLFRNLESEECWRSLFIFSTKRQKHFLQLILDTALSLIKEERFDELGDLVSPQELHPLKPVVLLLGWSLCKTSTVARRLLDVLWDEKSPCRHPALASGCRKLAYQIDLIQWCLDRTKPLLESSGIGVTNHERATHLLQGLEAHSVLFVLHQSTTLASLDQEEVLELLQNTARREDADAERKKKSVRFRLSGEDQNSISESCDDDTEDISIEQQRDLSIYRSFCAIRNVMDAIAFCADNADLDLMNPICVKKAPRPRSLSKSFICDVTVSSSEGEDSSCQDPGSSDRTGVSDRLAPGISEQGFHDLYEQSVTQKLADTRNHLKKLHPLTYRIEVLEDIFSLLFTTHRDVQDYMVAAECDSDEGAEDTSKRNSRENMSLNTSLISEDDMSPMVPKSNPFSSNAPVLESRSVPIVSSGYDEPFQVQKAAQVSQSVHRQVVVPDNQIAEQVLQSAASKLNSENKRPIPPRRRRYSSGTGLDHSGVFKLGFLANEYLVRDLLSMLKDCLLDVNPVKVRLLGQKSDSIKKSDKSESDAVSITPSLEESLTQFVKSSVTPDTLQKRLTRLTQYIHEAQWRFQLVSHDQLPKQPGQVLQRPVFVPGDDNFDICRTNSFRTSRSKSPHRLSASSNGDSETQGSPADVDSRQRSRSGQRASLSSSSKLIKAGLEIIPLMLSTPETLLTMSLSKGNFAQAAQVIKLFKLESSETAAEVTFSEAYHKSAGKLSTLESSARERTGDASQLGRPSMRALANVAAAGVASASLLNITDELLSSKTLAKLPSTRSSSSSNVPSFISSLFSEIDSATAILVDLLFTSCKTWDLCNKMLDVIKARVTLDTDTAEPVKWRDGTTTVVKKSKDVKLRGTLSFLKQVEKLVHTFSEDESLKVSSEVWQISKLGLGGQLRTSSCPLDGDRAKTTCRVIEEIARLVDKINHAFESLHDLEKQYNLLYVSPATSPQSSPKESSPSPKVKDTAKTSGIHATFKQFVAGLDRHVPRGGLICLLKRPGSDGGLNKNYLLSLYEHVRELAILVAECDSRTKDRVLIPQNYFHTLQEGPVSILGRLLFAKKMMPTRLESVAKKLSLSLTHIIVHSCCPRIPSKHLPPLHAPQLYQDYETFGPKIIYNSGAPPQSSLSEPSHPEELVRHILQNILSLMKEMAADSSAQGIFDTTCAKLALKKPEFRDVLSQCHQLKTIDMTQLTSREQLMCFCGNLQNLMMIHLYLHHIWQRTLNQAESEPQEDEQQLSGEFVLVSTIDSIVHLDQFAYRVGQLGVISLFELKFILCRIGLPPPVNWSGLVSHRNLDRHDTWMQFAPALDARLVCVLSDACVSSPPVQVLCPDTLDDQLQTSLSDYLYHTVNIDLQAKKVTIPALLSWYKQDFSQSTGVRDAASMEGLLHVIATSLEGGKGEELQHMLDAENTGKLSNDEGSFEQPYCVTLSDFVFEFGFVFEMSALPKDHSNPSPKDSVSPPGLDCSIDSLLDRSDRSFMVETPSYQLTPITLDYVKNDSALVATMVSLVCADELDDIEQHIQDDHFESSSVKSRTTSMSDISLVDIRSYRYQRLMDDYPILQRHLLNYIIPLAAAENPEILQGSDQVLKFVTNDIDDSVKTCMFSLHDSIQFQQVVLDIINRRLLAHKWAAILMILKSIPETTMKQRSDWQILHDFVLSCWAEEESLHNPDSSDIISKLRRFYCPGSHARTVLSVCRHLQVDVGIDLLESCLVSRISDTLKTAVDKKLQELNVYLKITDSVKNIQFKLSKQTSDLVRLEDMESARKYHSALERFTDWRNVVKCSESSPLEVVAILYKTGDFDMIKAWSKLHPLSQQLRLEIEEQHLMALLSSDKPNTTKSFQILEDVRKEDVSVCLSICDNLLKKLSSQRDQKSRRHRDIQFITSYMLNQLTYRLSDAQTEELRLKHIGAKALLCLPSSTRGDYSHLISTPHLILEQLFMNMKCDLAGQVYKSIRHDFSLVNTASLRYTTEQFNQLLETYALKAVEVMVVQTMETEKERSQSAGSGSSGKTDDTDPNLTLTPGQRYLGESIRVKRKLEGAVSPKPIRAQSPPVASPRKRSLSSSPHVPPAPPRPYKFIMPPQPPAKDQWVPDSAASVCMVCSVERFSMFNRRHHCRRCGRVVCASCSTRRTIIDGESSRTCDDCYSQRFGNSDSKNPTEHEFYAQRIQERLSGSMSGSPYSQTAGTSPGRSLELVATDNWTLRNDDKHDEELREEFYYEQAPSVSLCISILSHHSNEKECGQQMLSMCDYLSEFLQPVAPGVPNPEVDYSLIISMMRQLLFQGKVRFLSCGENQGVGLCDMYQTRVDLLKILVAANYKDLPSIKELTKVDTVRRLRDKLIEDERLPLAMEVSTKCGLDPSGVWSSWGKACLYIGDYVGAREKFSHCLKCPPDKNQAGGSTRLMQEIVDYLESMPITGTTEIQNLLSSPASIKTLINLPSASHSEEGSLETAQYQECLFYLRTYGSYLEHLTFLRRNGYWMKAAQFVITHRCSSEVFVEGLLAPALVSGELGKLLDQMLMLDPGLEKWSTYLTSTCKHLLKHRLFHALYQVQLFMKDFIRAAMTCITHFYQRGAESYIDLGKRLQFLFKAQQHMQAYLDPGQWLSVRHPATLKKGPDWSGHSAESAVRLVLTPDEVSKHIRTIALQIEVTKYLEQCLNNQEGDSVGLATSYVGQTHSANLPVLFGNNKVRADLVGMVLLSGSDITVSFDLSLRIIKECHLSSTTILTHTSREMAKHQRYGLIKRLLECVEKSGLGSDDNLDEIIQATLLVMADRESEAKEVDNFIKMLRKDSNKINAYILCGKLRSAYLLAVKGDRVEDVQRIAGAAQRMNQSAVKNICNKWLQQRK